MVEICQRLFAPNFNLKAQKKHITFPFFKRPPPVSIQVYYILIIKYLQRRKYFLQQK